MVRIVLVRPGSTAFDEEGRIKGALDIPLSANGASQAERTAEELANFDFDAVYSSPCESARQTAGILARRGRVKNKPLIDLRNLDHGLWQGKLIDDVRRHQPRVYKQFQECPDSVCPPGGETVERARLRMRKVISKIQRKHHGRVVAVVIPEPLASLFKHLVVAGALGDLWKSEQDSGHWEMIPVSSNQLVLA